MKKLLVIALSLLLCMSLFACGKQESGTITAKPITITEPTETTEATVPTEDTTTTEFLEDVFEDEEIPEDGITVAVEAAMDAIASYLNSAPASYNKMIPVLEAEGHEISDLTTALGYMEVDWNEQAAEAAVALLESETMSPAGLEAYLETEGFRPTEIEYALESCGDWNEIAVSYAKDNYADAGMDNADLIAQLVADGFTSEQAAYAAGKL